MRRKLLVLSPVHPPDDPRIRGKLIRSLQDEWDITFAGIGRGPVDQAGINWVELRGGRIRRWFSSAGLLLRRRYDVASLHDPEMLPAALLMSLFGRTIVFDVHENVPAQLRSKAWLPRPLRRPLSWLAAWLLHLAEKRLEITLAEGGYAVLFKDDHPVFPNYLAGLPPPPRPADPAVGVVYLGDVTVARGLAVAVEAVAATDVNKMTILGRYRPDFGTELHAIAARGGLELDLRGFVTPNEALRLTARGLVGLSPLLDTQNYRDSLPTKVLEYLAVGIPTLASDLPGTRAIVGGKPGVVLVAPGDVAAWTSAVADAVADAELREDASSNATAIKESFLWPGDAVRDFYAGLV